MVNEFHLNTLLFLILRNPHQVSILSHNYYSNFKGLFHDNYVTMYNLPSLILKFVEKKQKRLYISFQLLKLHSFNTTYITFILEKILKMKSI